MDAYKTWYGVAVPFAGTIYRLGIYEDEELATFIRHEFGELIKRRVYFYGINPNFLKFLIPIPRLEGHSM